MDNFSISQLQQFSGIKAHTIRIWEQRYNALRPNRSEGNTRYYDNDQLRRLLNIVSLMDGDYKVSELCQMPDEKLFGLVKSTLLDKDGEKGSASYFVSQLLAAGVSYDAPGFEKIFSASLHKYGIKDTYTKVIYPLLDRIGMMWSSNSIPPAQEHFISNIIRQKLFSAIDNVAPARSATGPWLLFLPENEFHEIGLLFSYYLIRNAGKKVIYLGANVPLDTLIAAVKDTKPSNLMLFFVHNDLVEECELYCKTLTKHFSNINIHISGNEKLISEVKKGKSINWIHSVEELERELKGKS